MVEDAIEDLIALALEFKNGGAAAPPAPDPPDSESNSSAKASSIFCRFYRFPDLPPHDNNPVIRLPSEFRSSAIASVLVTSILFKLGAPPFHINSWVSCVSFNVDPRLHILIKILSR
jgi:hypothetical protein